MDLGIRQLRWAAASLLLALVPAACGTDETEETTTTDNSSTTVTAIVPVTAEIQLYEGTLTLNDQPLPAFQDVPIHDGDELMSQDPVDEDIAHARIRLGDEYTIEMFLGASLRVVTLRPPELGIHLYGGHISVEPTAQTSSQLKVETASSELKTVGGGAAFTLCQPATGSTCLLVEEGTVELSSAGATQSYHAREGTEQTAMFLVPDEPPADERCVPTETYEEWFELARVNDTDDALGRLVGSSPYCNAERIIEPATVPGDVLWTDTEVDVEMGDTLHIEGAGTVQHGTTTAFYPPDGNPEGSRTNNVPGLEDENHSALIGKIGESGAAFMVGSEHEMSVETAGRLFLGVNDIDVDNNAGDFVAIITITRSAGDS